MLTYPVFVCCQYYIIIVLNLFGHSKMHLVGLVAILIIFSLAKCDIK